MTAGQSDLTFGTNPSDFVKSTVSARWQSLTLTSSLYNHLLSKLSLPSSNNMDDQSQSPRFRALFDSALQDYQSQTCTTLFSHPLAEKLQHCDSVESVTAVLQEQARAFSDFRGGDGRIMKSLRTVVSVLYTLSENSALSGAIGLVRRKASSTCPKFLIHYSQAFPPANAIFAAFAILFAV